MSHADRSRVASAFAAVLVAALPGIATRQATAGQATATFPSLTPADAGARFGQATSAARHCPGGHATPRTAELAAAYSGTGRTAFDDAANDVMTKWNAALSCVEADPETGRMNVACRRVKRMSCRQAWIEVGPEGTAVPGLLELSLDGLGGEGGGAAPPNGQNK